jgi:hypothetical protein
MASGAIEERDSEIIDRSVNAATIQNSTSIALRIIDLE